MQSDFTTKFNICREATGCTGLSTAFKLTSGETVRYDFSRDSSVRVRMIMQYV